MAVLGHSIYTVLDEYRIHQSILGTTAKRGNDDHGAMTQHNPLSHPTSARSLIWALFPACKYYENHVNYDTVLRANRS